MDEQLKRNISAGHTWLRLLFMILFAFIFYIAGVVFWGLVVIQFLFVLISGQRNDNLTRFADSLCKFLAQTLRYLSFTSDEKPFPFADWPESTVETETEETLEAEAIEVEGDSESKDK